ncbi:MAG: hypothetical protein CR967_04595 [Proteobacteria bacterium]|nr:MAG: hypothetical protein CR967_04595 [Pseudomonadota bacterium]
MDQSENLGDKIEETLGLDEQEEETPQNETKKTEEKKSEDEDLEKGKEDKTKEQDDKNGEKDKKQDDIASEKIDFLNTKYEELLKESAKLDAKIEELSKKEVDLDDFYDNLDKHLSKEEQELEFEDKAKYLKIITTKAREYAKSKGNEEELEQSKAQKTEYETAIQRVQGIKIAMAKYPDFDYEKAYNFYENELNNKEKEKILLNAKTYADVYILTYEKYKNINPVKVKSQKTPDIPDVNDVRKKEADPKGITNNFKSEEELTKEALGL